MKIAIISDIHGNIYSLMNALSDIDNKKVDTIICLGDLVGYGPHPNEVVSMIRRRNILCLKGNYDASVVENRFSYIRENEINSFSLPWAVKELREENRIYLSNLPTSLSINISGKTINFVHGSPNKINEYLYVDKENTKNIVQSMSCDILVSAHTHLPAYLEIGNKLYLNCGSIGKPKIGRPNSTYLLLDIDSNGSINYEIVELEYDVKKIIKDMTMLDFPSSLIESFEKGAE